MNEVIHTAEYTPSAADIDNLRVVFSHLWDLAPKRDYDPRWSNGTGYFDGLTGVRGTPMFASTDPTGRKILYIGQMLSDESPLILFERYSGGVGPLILHAPHYYLNGGDGKFSTAAPAWGAIPYLAGILSSQLKILSK